MSLVCEGISDIVYTFVDMSNLALIQDEVSSVDNAQFGTFFAPSTRILQLVNSV